MRVAANILELVGATPLLRLGAVEPSGGAEIWAKLEGLNPGGSVKDRIGLAMVLAAEADGRLKPGGTVVEATAGNTGIGLTLAGVQRGYRVVLFIPERYSVEKQKLMRALGAEVVVTPTEEAMAGARSRARELAATIPGAVWVDQFSNPANPGAHEETTGREILEQCGGRLDAIVIGCGTGGTLMGTTRCLRRSLPAIEVVAVEPEGSVLGGGLPGPHEVEGIGMDEVHPIVDRSLIDEVIAVPDTEAFAMVRRLARACGVLAGSSAGAAVVASTRVAARLGSGQRVVTLVPDSCERYLSKGILELFAEES